MGSKQGFRIDYEGQARAALADYKVLATTCECEEDREFSREMVDYYKRMLAPKPKTHKYSSQYRGVSCDETHTAKFYARIYVNGKQKRLGCFDTAEEAAHAYDAEVIRLNLPYPLNFKE